MVDATIRDLGIAYVVKSAASAARAAGRLLEVLSPWLQAREAVGVYYPEHRAVPLALRALDIVHEVRQGRLRKWGARAVVS